MNKTTVKRGIGAVLLALLAAGLLAFLLKDKADQRQDIVDMPLPGSDSTDQSVAANGETKLPQLSVDNNSGNAVSTDGSVIASAGADGAVKTGEGVISSTTGAISASVSAVGDGVSGAVDAVASAGESALDFSVRPPTAKSSEFRELSDVNLINNGNENKATTTVARTATASTSATTETVAATSQTQTSTPSNTTRGNVVASTSARSGGEARLIDERTTAAPRSSRTETVISRQAASNTTRASQPKPVVQPAPAPKPSTSATGYAIQLLATSSMSRAQSLVDVMRKEGYKAYFTKVTQNGKLLYRVRIGQYDDKASATKAHQAMKRRYKKNADVNRSAVVSR